MLNDRLSPLVNPYLADFIGNIFWRRELKAPLQLEFQPVGAGSTDK
jgi:hypothetical protein